MIERTLFQDQIADTLRREILATAEVGQKLPSDAEQAKRFGVSVITVREALRRLCREGLLDRRQGSGTRVISVTAPAKRVALLTDAGLVGHAFYFHYRLAQLALQLLKAQGMEVDTVAEPARATDAGKGAPAKLLLGGNDRKVDAVLRVHGGDDPREVARLEDAGIPVVGLAENVYRYTVHADHAGLIVEATRFLIAQGRRRIAFVQYEQPELRRRGEEWFLRVHFREALEEAGVPYHPEWVCTAKDPLKPGSGWDHIHDLWAGRGEKPDAVLIGVDTLFAETAMALLTLGVRVPDEVLVVTHANKGSGMFYPFPVVKLEIDPDACAAAMVNVLLRRLRGETGIPKETLVPFHWRGLPEEAVAKKEGCGAVGGGR